MNDQKDDNRPFPIQQERWRDPKTGEVVTGHACTIPWWLAEVAYEQYHKEYPGQSLECLAERGGFGRFELVSLIRREL